MKQRIDILSREKAEELIENCFPDNTAVISFYDPQNVYTPQEYKPVDYSSVCKNTFYVCIRDTEPVFLGNYNLYLDSYFPEAMQVAEFIVAAKKQEMDIICQCEYGLSRSAACAAAIMEFFYKTGIEVFADYRYYPNKMIYHKLLEALKCVTD